MAINQIESYQSYFAITRRLLLLNGLWPGETGFFSRFAYLGNFFCLVLMFSVVTNFCRHHIDNLGLLMKGMSVGFSSLAAIIRTTCLLRHRKTVWELHNNLDNLFRQDLADFELRSIALTRLNTFKRASLTFVTSTFLLVGVYIFVPTLFMVHHRIFNENSFKRQIVFPAKYPWVNSTDDALYPVRFLFEVYAAFAVALVSTGIDAVFGIYILQITGILRVMSHRITNINENNDYRSVLRDCIVKHQIISHCCNDLQKIYGVTIIYILLTSSIVICVLIFQASTMGNLSFSKMVLFAFYIVTKMSQALMYSWFGTILTTESENFREAIYSSIWPDSYDQSIAVYILIIMAQKPLILTACNCFKVTMEMFASILNTAISYFLLLQTLDEKA